MNSVDPVFGLKICALREIPDGGGRIFQFPTEQGEHCLLVLRSAGCCYGYINRCPHFGMPLSACDSQLILESNRWVKCNVHYAKFTWQDGLCVAGDCEGESLQKVPLEIHNDQIWVFQAVTPNEAPIPAVKAIAKAPQKVTRTAATSTEAPPACAASDPDSARNKSEAHETVHMSADTGTKMTIKRGSKAPTVNDPADANAA